MTILSQLTHLETRARECVRGFLASSFWGGQQQRKAHRESSPKCRISWVEVWCVLLHTDKEHSPIFASAMLSVSIINKHNHVNKANEKDFNIPLRPIVAVLCYPCYVESSTYASVEQRLAATTFMVMTIIRFQIHQEHLSTFSLHPKTATINALCNCKLDVNDEISVAALHYSDLSQIAYFPFLRLYFKLCSLIQHSAHVQTLFSDFTQTYFSSHLFLFHWFWLFHSLLMLHIFIILLDVLLTEDRVESTLSHAKEKIFHHFSA